MSTTTTKTNNTINGIATGQPKNKTAQKWFTSLKVEASKLLNARYTSWEQLSMEFTKQKALISVLAYKEKAMIRVTVILQRNGAVSICEQVEMANFQVA